MKDLPPEALRHVADYFQALAEPARLRILNLLRGGEHSVGELAEKCGYSAANVSRHLATLTKHGFVSREGRGTSVYYRIADDSVFALCDLVCGSVGRQLERKARESELFVRGRKGSRTRE
jgi:DNA-binding transcriptional ArsR family regulator